MGKYCDICSKRMDTSKLKIWWLGDLRYGSDICEKCFNAIIEYIDFLTVDD